ncbi:MAG: HNH endonuclease signature motif containing protein [Candidatus Thorarchaeota archaeon]|nr:HNH endonuclease signature motif containing protein [Candidatus Thorarchaeota archaeon]
MTDKERQIQELFSKGYDIRELCPIVFPNTPMKISEKQVLSHLGFSTRREYTAASRTKQAEQAKEEATRWNDKEKANAIKNLFEQEFRLDEIRRGAFPEIFEITSKSEFYYQREIVNQIIYEVLECKDGADFKRIRNNLRKRNQHRRKRESGYFEARKAALERDGNKCVVTGLEENLQIHHIDGDDTNNKLENLITVCRDIQMVIHNGARGLSTDIMRYWKSTRPSYAETVQQRIDCLTEYAIHLRKRGYPNATMECIPAKTLLGPSGLRVKLSFNPRMKRSSGCYWVVALKPTGFHVSPDEYAAKEEAFWAERKKKYEYTWNEDDEHDDDFGFFFSREYVGTIGEPTECPKCKSIGLRTHRFTTKDSDEEWDEQECSCCGYSSEYED